MTDATIVNENGHGIHSVGINLTVNGIDTAAEGNNSISGAHICESGMDEEGYEYTASTPGHGIFSEGNGYPGNGSLVITGTLGDITSDGGDGINAYEDIVIRGFVHSVSCTGGISSGICSNFGSVIVEKTGNIGNILSEEFNGISASKNVIIAGDVGNITGSGYAGIHVTGGNVTISGNVESVCGLESGIESYSDIYWDEDGNKVNDGGNITINGTIGKISGRTIGIYADSDLNVSGFSEVTATCEEIDDGYALSVGGDIVLPDGKDIIAEPAEYQIVSAIAQAYEDESGAVVLWRNTVCDSDGTPALTVKFVGWTNPFEDVSISDWYYSNVEYTVVKGLFNGTTETTFSPDNNLTRAMLVTVLYRAEGEPATNRSITFADIDVSAYYANAVSWAQQNGIVNGTTQTTFAPDHNITREQIAAIMHRYAQYKGYDVSAGENTNILSYDDHGSVSEYAFTPVQYAVGSGLMKGKTTSTINPQDNATRAEIATILHRFIEANK